MPLVSVIVPTRDRPELLPRAVRSVLAQSEVSLEVIVVDNNRNTAPVRQAFAAATWLTDARVRVVRSTRTSNAAAARNAGLDAARGDWVSYLDDDDAYRPEKLARQLGLLRRSGSPLVLCGAEYHLRGRRRVVQCTRSEWKGDEILLNARWNTPLLLHEHPGDRRFDEALSPGEDSEFAQRLLADARADSVPVLPLPLVDIHPQPGARVNSNPEPLMRSAARILTLRPGFFSRAARRRFVLQHLLGVAKLRRRPLRCAVLGWRLLVESEGADWRPVANAFAVSLGILPGRWVS